MTIPVKYRYEYTLKPVADMPANVHFVAGKYFMSNYIGNEEVVCTVRDKLKRLLRTVATENPKWSFYCRAFAHLNLENFEVYLDEEPLGKIGYSQGKFHIGCSAIESDMERKDFKSTKDEGKAYKLARRIAPKSLKEHMEKAKFNVDAAIRSLASDRMGDSRKAMMSVMPYCAAFIRANPEAAKELLVGQLGCDAAYIDEVIESDAKCRQINAMKERKDHDYVTVLLHDGGYVVSNQKHYAHNGDIVEPVTPYWNTHNSDELPPRLRRNLGLLKLAEDGTLIDDVGYRYSANEFYVKVEE